MNNQDYLKVAVSAAKESGKIFTQFFSKPKNITIKGGNPKDLVTEIDKKIEKAIRKIIVKKFPSHKIIGEEFGGHELKKNDFVWIIDPIDGTTNYIQGVPFCCISIGLWRDNNPLMGVVYNPTMNQLFTAIKGKGAFLNGKKINVSSKNSLKVAFGGFGWGRNIHKAQINFPKLVQLLQKIRTLGSATLEMCLVAMGAYDFQIQSEIKVWDFAASTVIVQEAGGTVTEQTGHKLSIASKTFVASNGKIHKEMIAELKKAMVI